MLPPDPVFPSKRCRSTKRGRQRLPYWVVAIWWENTCWTQASGNMGCLFSSWESRQPKTREQTWWVGKEKEVLALTCQIGRKVDCDSVVRSLRGLASHFGGLFPLVCHMEYIGSPGSDFLGDVMNGLQSGVLRPPFIISWLAQRSSCFPTGELD